MMSILEPYMVGVVLNHNDVTPWVDGMEKHLPVGALVLCKNCPYLNSLAVYTNNPALGDVPPWYVDYSHIETLGKL
jgi:hypothetical protein